MKTAYRKEQTNFKKKQNTFMILNIFDYNGVNVCKKLMYLELHNFFQLDI